MKATDYPPLDICKKFGAAPFPVDLSQKIGISDSVKEAVFPVNGLRHLPSGDTSGWYIWADEEIGTNEDYFKPLHLKHLHECRPDLIRFMSLPPGWRFLVAPDYEDAWFDPSLLIE